MCLKVALPVLCVEGGREGESGELVGEAFCLFPVTSQLFSSLALRCRVKAMPSAMPQSWPRPITAMPGERGSVSQLTFAGGGRLSTDLLPLLPSQAGATALAGKAEWYQRCANHGGFSFCQLRPHQGTAL